MIEHAQFKIYCRGRSFMNVAASRFESEYFKRVRVMCSSNCSKFGYNSKFVTVTHDELSTINQRHFE
jgi:hypothetical protein